ncbi:MAG: cytochrome c oxidase assembly protein [Gammaproteobacteria bacterium]|nr:cytochrome c oxidase assembly protein [Gammaproteobacteria bacterium]MDH3409382.1 cytochrome c oxidase assembly protein [Gammaproteobacteria bacterium]MDH3552204.1 cytochrome c oxidase assembly protein [Gammaproteobacteria bacterium]
MNDPHQQPRLSNRSLTVRLLIFAVGMFAFGFLVLPPLYDVFCDITGFGGRTNANAIAATEAPDLTRTIRVEFVTTVNQYAPWEFSADIDSMEVHPGKMYFATFSATNLSAHLLVGQAVPSVAPVTANEHFKKIECFCFTSQQFAANEQRALPLQFIVDPDLPDYVDTITLSYTLFDIAPVATNGER